MSALTRFIFPFAFLLSIQAFSQHDDSIHNPDTARTFFPKTFGTKKWKPLISLDANRSFYEGKPIKLNGIRLGVESMGTHRFGIGYYWLGKKGLPVELPVEIPGPETDSSFTNLRIFYGTLFYERVFFKTKRWEIAFPSHFGAGGIAEIHDENQPGLLKNPGFFSLSTGLIVKFYIWPWLAPHVGFKYRQLLNGEELIRQAFSGPYYSFGVKVSVGELYRAIFNDTKSQK